MKNRSALRLIALAACAMALRAAAQGRLDGRDPLPRVPAMQPVPMPDAEPAPGRLLADMPRRPVPLTPTAFTPDGDGLNDKYFPHLVGIELGLSRFQVFDRWGRPLFSSTSGEGWDGTLEGGAALPQGIYLWHLEAWPANSDQRLELAGSVMLIR